MILSNRMSGESLVGPLPDYPQTTVDKVASAFEFIDYLIVCLCVGKYYHLSPHPPLSPLLRNSKKFAVFFYGPLNRRSDVTPGDNIC